jgi:hypothetical protein
MKYLRCPAGIEPLDSQHLDLEKPLLREVFRDLGVTSGPALTLVSDGLNIVRDFDALETLGSKLDKKRKVENPVPKNHEISQKPQKSKETDQKVFTLYLSHP